MSITVHPITVDPETQGPVYTAHDYRRSVNSLLFPSDGSTFNSLNCVSASSPTHVLTNAGSVVTVLPHSGFMSPFAGESAYTYTITDMGGENNVTVPAATGHYKIAVVVTDPSAGQGATPGGKLAVYSSSTADSAIPGIVLGEYDNGTVTDTAIRWQNQGVLIASTLTQLNTMAAVNGQLARIGDVEYERKNGAWFTKSRVLFEDSSAVLGNTVTLSQPVSEFRVLEIEYYTNMAGSKMDFHTATIPIMGATTYSVLMTMNPSPTQIWFKARQIIISGTSIKTDTSSDKKLEGFVTSGGDGAFSIGPVIAITRVTGIN